jgi:hypothetical protein
MTTLNSDGTREMTSNQATSDDQIGLPAVIRQIRLCRSTLGAILDELECDNRSAESIDRLAACTTSVFEEIDCLWEATKQSGS